MVTGAQAEKAGSTYGDNGTQSPAPAATPEAQALQSLFEFDPKTDQLVWSNAAVVNAMTGVAASTAGTHTDDQGSAIALEAYLATLLPAHVERRAKAVAEGKDGYSCEYQFCHADGHYLWVEERGGWIGQGENRRLVGVIRSIDAQKQREERLSWLAQHDELTGLLNRVSLRACIDGWLDEARPQGRTGAYFLVGVDDLGAVNADFGFEIADQVIVEIARRLQSKISADDYLGRVAGTKFGILIRDANEENVRTL